MPALTRTNKAVLKHYLKASEQQKANMVIVLREQIDNLNLLLRCMVRNEWFDK